MKITEGQLRRIIRQEVQALRENQPWPRNAWPRPSASTHSRSAISADASVPAYGTQEIRIDHESPAGRAAGDIAQVIDSRLRAGELSELINQVAMDHNADPGAVKAHLRDLEMQGLLDPGLLGDM